MRTSAPFLLAGTLALGACSTSSPSQDAAVGDVGLDAHHDPVDGFVVPHDIGPDVFGDVGSFDTGDDGSRLDAAEDGGPPCSPAGTYGVTWVPAAANPSDCTTPAGSIQVGSDGLSSSGVPECSGCGTGECEVQPATPASCHSAVHLEAPCGDLSTSQIYDSTFTFGDDGMVDATNALTRADGSVCSFTGSGPRS